MTGNPDPPWCSYIHIFNNVTNENDKKVALQIGIAEGQLYAYSRNPPKWGQSDADPTLLKYKRFYAALMLNFLVNEMPVGKVADKFEVPRGSLQTLQDKAATFANMVSGFCQRLNWWDLEVLTGSYAKQLNYGCQTDVLPLCEIPVRVDMIRHARIKYAGKSQSCMVYRGSRLPVLAHCSKPGFGMSPRSRLRARTRS